MVILIGMCKYISVLRDEQQHTTMKHIITLLLLALSAVSFVSCASGPSGTQNRATANSVRTETTDEAMVARELIALTNQHRQRIGKEALNPDFLLKGLAMEHSVYLAYNHSGGANLAEIAHAGVNQRSKVVLMRSNQLMGENVVWADADHSKAAQILFETLMNSTQHRKAIEGSNWHKMGISVVKKNGAFYATQLFGRPHVKAAPVPQMVFM